MTEHPNYKYRPRRRKHTKPRAGPQANLANSSSGNNKNNSSNSSNNTNNNNTTNSNSSNSGVQLMANGTPSSISSSSHNQSSQQSDVQYERMSPYNYNQMYYNDGSSLASPGNSTPSPSPPNSRASKKMNYKMEDGVSTTPEMSPMDHQTSTKIDFEQALPSTTTTFNSSSTSNTSSKSRYGFDNSFEANNTKNDYHYGNNDRMYDEQASHENNKKSNFGNSLAPPSAGQATTIAAMGNGMYVMCTNRGILDQGHVVTGTYFPPLPTSQDHQNLGSSNILSTTSSQNHHIHHQHQHHQHHQHHQQQQQNHYNSNTQTTSATNLILSSSHSGNNNNNDGKYNKSNDNNNNKHGSENNNNEMNNCANSNSSSGSSKNEGNKNFKKSSSSSSNTSSSSLKCGDEISDDKLIKNDSNNNSNNQDNKNNSSKIDMNNRLVMSSPTMAALSPYHHQSPYLSQYKNHINYSDQSAATAAAIQQQHDDINNSVDPSQQSNMNKYNNFVAEYDPYQNNPIYYHPSTHFAHSHALQQPPTSSTAFYVTNPEYYHQSYTMAPTAPTTIVQPMVAKIDAVIGATSIPLHPSQALLSDPYVTAEQLKEDDFSNILAGVRKTCYSN